MFPFGATANPPADLPLSAIRDTIADMIARIVGQKPGRASGLARPFPGVQAADVYPVTGG